MIPLKFKNFIQIFTDFLLKINIILILRLFEFDSSGNYGELQSLKFETLKISLYKLMDFRWPDW